MKKITVFICLLICLSLGLFIMASCSDKNMDYYIFQDIEECQNIISLNYTNGEFVAYNNPNNDKNLKDLKHIDFFAGKYKSDELIFEIYAYQFENANEARRYFNNVTGKNAELETNFSSSQGISQYRLIVIDGEYAYCVTTSKSNAQELIKVLEKIFSKKISSEIL